MIFTLRRIYILILSTSQILILRMALGFIYDSGSLASFAQWEVAVPIL